jgi:hypothetical protein
VDSERGSSTDAANCARRKRFYCRLGSRQIDGLTYIMPQVASAKPPLMDMLVYRRELPDSVDKAQVRTWLAACYGQVYGTPENDERIARMVDGLPGAIRLI